MAGFIEPMMHTDYMHAHIELQPVQDSHLAHINPIVPGSEEVAKQSVAITDPLYHETVLFDDTPIAIWGVNPMWEGVCDLWIVFDTEAPRHLLSLFKLAKTRLSWLEERGFRRIEAKFFVGAPTLPLAEKLGFEVEGFLKNYGLHGEGDYVMIARCNNGNVA